MTRLKMSRPSASVPNRCAALGGISFAVPSVMRGSYGASIDPNAPHSSSRRRIATATSVRRFSPNAWPILRVREAPLTGSVLEPNARIDDGCEQIDNQVEQHIKHRHHQHE